MMTDRGVNKGILLLFCILLFAPLSALGLTRPMEFKKEDLGRFPEGWRARREEAKEIYNVRRDGNGTFLEADSSGEAHTIGYEIAVDLAATPYLEFSWRARILPPKGDERRKETNDSVLGVYVAFRDGVIPHALKYVWSTTLPVGTETVSPHTARSRVIVLESGGEKVGHWVAEKVNVLADYRRIFGKKTVPPVIGIGLMTDADDTRSRAAGDYASLRFSSG